MIFKFIFPILLVWQRVSASTSFFEDGQRAEFFELTDNEVPVFRVTIPDESYTNLINSLQLAKMEVDDIFGGEQNLFNGDDVFGTDVDDKIKDATLEVEINGQNKTFNKITFASGGSSARTYGRQGFNLKIRGKEKLFGRSQFRFRSDARDATTIRSKLACDMHNRLGLVSISANYAELYVNNNYLGFYVIMDAPKLPWIEELYGEKDTQNLYKCKAGGNFLSEASCAERCENENDEVTDKSEWIKFLRAVDNAKTPEDLEDIFEIDQFLYELAYDYLSGGWDHLTASGHNYSLYKQKTNGKWIMYYYDYDGDFGQDIVTIEFGRMEVDPSRNYPAYDYKYWFGVPMNIIDVLVFNDPTRFENILRKVVDEVFNPAVLFPHIDEVKQLITPYIKKIKTPDETGYCPGIINKLNPVDYSYEEWDANCEFTTINNEDVSCSAYGLKYWILGRYRAVCNYLNMECDPVYMDEDYEYPVDKDVEGEINIHLFDGVDFSQLFGPPADAPTDNSEQATTQKYQCWSEITGYPCCSDDVKEVYAKDANGEWSYDFVKNTWCGLTPYQQQQTDETCWAEKLGYRCCDGCYVYSTDNDGKWGYENGHWCGVQSFCS